MSEHWPLVFTSLYTIRTSVHNRHTLLLVLQPILCSDLNIFLLTEREHYTIMPLK